MKSKLSAIVSVFSVLMFAALTVLALLHSLITWILYVPVVWLDHWYGRKWWFRKIVEPIWGAIDFLFNKTSARLLFRERAREPLFTYRMRRYLSEGREALLLGYEPAWQYHLAVCVCAMLLDPVAPKGQHCRCNEP